MKVGRRKMREIRALADASYEALVEVAKASKARQLKRRVEERAAATAKPA